MGVVLGQRGAVLPILQSMEQSLLGQSLTLTPIPTDEVKIDLKELEICQIL